mmetsp:Transcript_61121/g.126627  ORF Transcript_61121/g.126627 Transcript_61121/m.126627 type:complete len:220 (-) Transcript_61121:389-1048(-)
MLCGCADLVDEGAMQLVLLRGKRYITERGVQVPVASRGHRLHQVTAANNTDHQDGLHPKAILHVVGWPAIRSAEPPLLRLPPILFCCHIPGIESEQADLHCGFHVADAWKELLQHADCRLGPAAPRNTSYAVGRSLRPCGFERISSVVGRRLDGALSPALRATQCLLRASPEGRQGRVGHKPAAYHLDLLVGHPYQSGGDDRAGHWPRTSLAGRSHGGL